MIIVDGNKFYTPEEAAELSNMTIVAIRKRISENHDIVTEIGGRQHIAAEKMKLLAKPIKEDKKK